MIIDCKQCSRYDSDECDDCLVKAVLSPKHGSRVEIESEQEPAILSLQEAGLAPLLKFRRKAG